MPFSHFLLCASNINETNNAHFETFFLRWSQINETKKMRWSRNAISFYFPSPYRLRQKKCVGLNQVFVAAIASFLYNGHMVKNILEIILFCY